MCKPSFLKLPLLCFLLTAAACYSDRPVELVAERLGGPYRDSFPAGPAEVSAMAGVRPRLDSLEVYRRLLLEVDTHGLSAAGKAQRQVLLREVESEWTVWEPYRSNPALYNLGGLLKQRLAGPPADKLPDLVAVAQRAGDYYTWARGNLVVQDAALFRLAAHKQYLTLEFVEGELKDSITKIEPDPARRVAVEEEMARLRRAVKDYLAFCESAFINHRDSSHYAARQ